MQISMILLLGEDRYDWYESLLKMNEKWNFKMNFVDLDNTRTNHSLFLNRGPEVRLRKIIEYSWRGYLNLVLVLVDNLIWIISCELSTQRIKIWRSLPTPYLVVDYKCPGLQYNKRWTLICKIEIIFSWHMIFIVNFTSLSADKIFDVTCFWYTADQYDIQ